MISVRVFWYIHDSNQSKEISKGVKNILVSRTLFHHKHYRAICVFGLLLAMALTSSAFAVENIAAYPYLPKGYKSIRVFDSQGRFVGRVLADKRYWVEIEQIPVFLQKALIAIEDVRFYEHGGGDTGMGPLERQRALYPRPFVRLSRAGTDVAAARTA